MADSPSGNSAPAAPQGPATPAFLPKVGGTCTLTETDPKTKKVVSYLFLVTETGTADEIVRDKDGGIVFKDQAFPIGDGKSVTRRIATTQKVTTYSGFAFNAFQAACSPRRNVSLDSLSALA